MSTKLTPAQLKSNRLKVIVANKIKNTTPKMRKLTSERNKVTKKGANNHFFGTNGPMGGKKHTLEAKQKSARHGTDNGMFGRKLTGDLNGFFGKTHTAETRESFRLAALSREKNHHCEHCGGDFTAQSYKQHHGDKCKHNPNREPVQKRGGWNVEHPVKECPHCGKIGRGPNMTRYHFDNCKEKHEQ